MARYAYVAMVERKATGERLEVTGDALGYLVVSEAVAKEAMVRELAGELGGSPMDYTVVAFSAFECSDSEVS